MLGLLIVVGSLFSGFLIDSLNAGDEQASRDDDLSAGHQDDEPDSLESDASPRPSILDWAADPSTDHHNGIPEVPVPPVDGAEVDTDPDSQNDTDLVPEDPLVIALDDHSSNFGGTEDAEFLHVDTGFQGVIDTAAGDDTVDAHGRDLGRQTSTIDRPGLHDFTWVDHNLEVTDEAPVTILLGDGDDRIEISGAGFEINTGSGRDSVDMNTASQAIVWANAGDQVLGSNLGTATDLHIVIDGAGQFDGGSADEHALALNDGATLQGGAGNDTIESDDGAAMLYGGTGNDVLLANVRGASFEDASSDRIGYHLDASSDLLFGGAGDDEIFFGRFDVATGGAGADRFTVYDNNGDGSAAVIRDFNPDEDQLVIYSGGVQSDQSGGSKTLQETISIVEQDGSTIVMNGSVEIVRLEGATNLNFGLAMQGSDGSTNYAALDGTLGSPISFDAIILAYPETSS